MFTAYIAIFYARDAKTARDAGFQEVLLASRLGGAFGTVSREGGTESTARDAGFLVDLLASLEANVYICVRLNLIFP